MKVKWLHKVTYVIVYEVHFLEIWVFFFFFQIHK